MYREVVLPFIQNDFRKDRTLLIDVTNWPAGVIIRESLLYAGFLALILCSLVL